MDNIPTQFFDPKVVRGVDDAAEEHYAALQGCPNPELCRRMHGTARIHTALQYEKRVNKKADSRYERAALHHEKFHPQCPFDCRYHYTKKDHEEIVKDIFQRENR